MQTHIGAHRLTRMHVHKHVPRGKSCPKIVLKSSIALKVKVKTTCLNICINKNKTKKATSIP